MLSKKPMERDVLSRRCAMIDFSCLNEMGTIDEIDAALGFWSSCNDPANEMHGWNPYAKSEMLCRQQREAMALVTGLGRDLQGGIFGKLIGKSYYVCIAIRLNHYCYYLLCRYYLL